MKSSIPYFDVCIIGGSIAGNYLAFLLSKFNFKIAIIEEHGNIGLPFQCAGIVSQKLTKLINLPEKIILNRVEIAKIVAPSGKYIKLSGNEHPYVIDRIGLDKFFYEKAKINIHIHYFLNEKFKSFNYRNENNNKIVEITTSKRKLRAKILVGCDGPLSLVAKSFGIKNNLIYASQIRVEHTFSQNEAVLLFDPKWKELIGWIVPEGSNNIYRIGVASAKNVSKNLNLLLKKLHINTNSKIDQQGGIIPYGYMNGVAFNNTLLLGDAACQVKATTGGGIVMLLTAAKYAAICIKKCLQTNKFSKKCIKKYYEKPCKASIGKELKIHYAMRKIFENFINSDYENLFQLAKTEKIEHLISLYGDMDFPKSLVLKLLKNSTILKFTLRLITKKPVLLFKLIRDLI